MCFHEDEIEAMLCGQGETWTVELLAEALKFDHGSVDPPVPLLIPLLHRHFSP